MGITENEMSSMDIDSKLAALEEEPEVEVEVDPEPEEVEEEEEDSAPSEDDTVEEEPLETEGDDDDEEEEEVELSEEEDGLLKTAIAERKKRQKTETELSEIKETLQKLQETVVKAQAPTTLEEAYERDPKGVTDNINANIAQAVEQGDTLEAERLRDLKEDLRVSTRTKQETKKQTEQKQTEIATLLYSSIPDFDKEKAAELTKFAIEQLGYEDADLTEKTNINKYGTEAVKEIVRINKAFQKSQVPTQAKKKKVKKATSVEKGGKGIKKTVVKESQLVERAKKTGKADDWMQVIDARFAD